MHTRPETRFLDSGLVRTLLDAVGTQFVTVDFVKKDGSPRTVNGLLRPTSRFVGSERGKAQGERMKSAGQVFIGEASGAPKSFFLNRVTGIRCKGAGIEARADS